MRRRESAHFGALRACSGPIHSPLYPYFQGPAGFAADCLDSLIGVHSAPFVVPLPAFFSGLASRVMMTLLFRPTSEKSDETANVGLGPKPKALKSRNDWVS